MTSPLDEKAVAAAHEAYAKTTGGLLDGNPMANAIRAYLSATALPDGMEVVAWQVEHGGGATFWNVEDNARRNAEAMNGTAHALVRADQAQSALAAMRVERDRNATEYETVLNSYADENQRLHDRVEAAEQQVRDMVDALNWALGATGEFQPSGVGTGPFWWRAELAARVGLTFDREAHTYRLALKNQESDRG